jgi:hypothetical protein
MAFKNAYYKYLFLILFFISQNLFAQNPNPKGITIITHGFQLFGSFDPYWYDFAAAIKQRAGMYWYIASHSLMIQRYYHTE